MKTPKTFNVSVLLLNENGLWIAQCLEYDITAQGKRIKEAMQAFEEVFVGQAVLDIEQGKKPFEGISKAPPEYWKMFNEGERLADTRTFKQPETIPNLGLMKANERRIFA